MLPMLVIYVGLNIENNRPTPIGLVVHSCGLSDLFAEVRPVAYKFLL